MSANDKSGIDKISTEERPRKPLPQGYRQGIITAITVLLGFSLSFLRFWGFEAPDQWTWRSTTPAVTLIGAIVIQIIAVYRALRLEDDEENESPENGFVARCFGRDAFVRFGLGCVGSCLT